MLALTHSSYWQETQGHEIPRYDELRHDVMADVAILGGGITGLPAARHLKAAGKRVVVLEAGHVGGGTSGFTSGHLDATTDTPLAEMISHFGEDVARHLVAASQRSIDQIENWCREFGDCEFARLPSFQYTESTDEFDELERQAGAARKLGLNASMTQAIPLPFRCGRAVRVEGQGRFHVLRYLTRLAAAVHGGGCMVFENTRASIPEETAEGCRIETSGGNVQAKDVFVATHGHFLGISQFDFRVFPYQSYVIGARVDAAVPDALYWDDADPYHYIRLASPAEPDLLLIGGADHKTGQGGSEQDAYRALEEYAAQRFAVREVESRWSSQYFQPADGLPHIGRVPGRNHVFMATGFSGTGLTLGTVAAEVIADLIQGRTTPLAEALQPGRATLRASVAEVVSENLNVAKRFVADRFGIETVESLAQVPIGQGKVVRLRGEQLAVYRESPSVAHVVSAVCTHAGCIVHWNEAERTWDCPCHGGRYDVEGNCFAGPPPSGLAKHAPNS